MMFASSGVALLDEEAMCELLETILSSVSVLSLHLYFVRQIILLINYHWFQFIV